MVAPVSGQSVTASLTNVNHFQRLPLELIKVIFSITSLFDHSNYVLVCKRWKEIIEDDKLLKLKLEFCNTAKCIRSQSVLAETVLRFGLSISASPEMKQAMYLQAIECTDKIQQIDNQTSTYITLCYKLRHQEPHLAIELLNRKRYKEQVDIDLDYRAKVGIYCVLNEYENAYHFCQNIKTISLKVDALDAILHSEGVPNEIADQALEEMRMITDNQSDPFLKFVYLIKLFKVEVKRDVSLGRKTYQIALAIAGQIQRSDHYLKLAECALCLDSEKLSMEFEKAKELVLNKNFFLDIATVASWEAKYDQQQAKKTFEKAIELVEMVKDSTQIKNLLIISNKMKACGFDQAETIFLRAKYMAFYFNQNTKLAPVIDFNDAALSSRGELKIQNFEKVWKSGRYFEGQALLPMIKAEAEIWEEDQADLCLESSSLSRSIKKIKKYLEICKALNIDLKKYAASIEVTIDHTFAGWIKEACKSLRKK